MEFGYERVPIGTRFVFHRADPFSAVPLPPTAGNGRQRPPTAGNGRQRPASLPENDRRILEFLRSHGTSPTALVSEELSIPVRTARTALRRLTDAGLIERLGADRNSVDVQ